MFEVNRRAHVIHARDEVAAEHLPVGDNAADGHAAEVDPVVAAFPADQTCALAFAADPVVAEGDLQRGVYGLRSRVGEEGARERRGCHSGQALGKLEGAITANLEAHAVIKLLHLRLYGFDDLRVAVAYAAGPQPGEEVVDPVSVESRVVMALSAAQDPRTLLEVPI